MLEENKEEGIKLTEIFKIIKKNILYFIISAIIFMGVGYVYSINRTRNYTATVPVNYSASAGTDYRESINLMSAYILTIRDFCSSDIVVDCANYYYDCFLKAEGFCESIDDFILKVKNEGYYSYEEAFAYEGEQYIDGEKIKSVEISEDNLYNFAISYSDIDRDSVADKLRIIVLAFDTVAKDFFEGAKTTISEIVESSRDIPVSSDFSLKKILIISVIIGFAVAGVFVFLKTYFDDSIKDENQLSQITGSDVIALIER